ncbi:M56 family metallopeptidase [Flavobacterium caeni]|uniref:Signal transducer regulating beta-lactamase production, contains metallopeptidase domain n=1 Tax=Flavobacterium caeni TaxID=490189 RepID=A0A1G5BL95_9FLAO|nr:M56 family metallopeptidase [Flavobacterium caeni]SCX90951.1 Signal transducer regulating beta-lactamase production, contains metallopeptidase domain [Flavobacterium caeni]
METLAIYLIKSGALLAAFYLAYYLLLRKETFFNSNRWFLLLGLVTSICLPLVTFKKIVWVEPTPDAEWTEVPVALAATPATSGFEIDWFLVAALAYAIGLFAFLIKFIFDFGSLVKTIKGQPVKQQADFKLVDVPHNVSPFSYFNYIVYNSDLYSAAELENILEHEKVHCEQKHSADVLVARLFCILFWFNPFVWLYKKAMLQNLEFIADSGALKNISDKKAYQFTLLKVTTHEHCVEITNHFYQSLIKKRIVMLNKNQSKKWNAWKYALIVPVLAAFMFYFQVNVIAQEKTTDVVALPVPSEEIVIDKNTTDAQLEAYSDQFKQKYGVKLKFSKVKRNAAGEIVSIKAQYDDKNKQSGTWQMSGDEPIKPVRLTRKDDGSIAFGSEKKVRIIRHSDDVADTETDSTRSGKKVYSYSYSYDSDEDGDEPMVIVNGEHIPLPPDPPCFVDFEKVKADINNNLHVKTITSKDGKVVVSGNGEVIDIDPDKIMAEIDIEGIKAQARAGVRIAKDQARIARKQVELARHHAGIAEEDAEDAKQEMEEARREMEEARREMEESKRELEEARRELQKEKAALKAKKSSSKSR